MIARHSHNSYPKELCYTRPQTHDFDLLLEATEKLTETFFVSLHSIKGSVGN